MMTCRICGDKAVSGHFVAAEMMYGTREKFGYSQCANCHCLQIDQIPTDLPRFYEQGYYSYRLAIRKKNPLKRWAGRLRARHAVFGGGLLGRLLCKRTPETELRSLRPLQLDRDSRVLDVGCGAGHLLFSLGEIGMRRVSGADPFIPNEVVYDNGVVVKKIDLFQAQGQWDLIMFHHSFEHLPDPKATLLRVAQLLAPGGHCLLRVPTVTSYAWRHYGVNWVQLDAPRHLYLLAHESVQSLAKATGFSLERISHDSTGFQFWGSEQYIKNIPLRDERSGAGGPGIFSAAELAGFDRRALEVNQQQQGDQAVFYLRKLD